MLRSNKSKLIIGIFISAVFLYLALRKVDLYQMVSSLEKASYYYLLPAAIFLFLSLLLRAYRWGIFFRPLKQMRLKNLFSALLIGNMANNVLPFRMGEFLRAYSLGKSENFSKVTSFATIVVERILDVMTLLIILGITVLFQPFPSYLKRGGLILFIISCTAILFLAFLVIKSESTTRLYRKLIRFLPKKFAQRGEKVLQALLNGLVILKRPRYYFMIIVSSGVIWFSYVMIVQMLVYAFHFDVKYQLTLLASATILVMTGISVSVPSSPGYVGTYHYLVMLGLELYHVPNSEAFSFAVVIHLFTMLPMSIVGLYYFMKQQLTMQSR